MYDEPPQELSPPVDLFNPLRENNPSGPELAADDMDTDRDADAPTVGLVSAVVEEHAVDALVAVVETVGGEEGAPPS